MLKVIVFGGGGFFARSFYSQLLSIESGAQVFSISRSGRGGLPAFVTELTADVCRFESLEQLPDCFDDARCLYLADPSSESIPSEDVRFRNMTSGIRNVVKFCQMRQIKDLTYASSGAVYEDSSVKKVESDGLRQTFGKNYASAKIYAEQYVRELGVVHGINCKIARCFSFVGEFLPNTHFAIMNFIGSALSGDNIEVKGSGLEVRSYLHQCELGNSLLNLVLFNRPLTVNVGSEKAVSILELARQIADTYSLGVIGPRRSALSDKNFYVPSTEKYRSLFGPVERLSLSERIDLTYLALSQR